MNAVLVHGIFNSGRIFSYMQRHLENNGFNCFVPSLKPSDGRAAIEELSNNLRDQINNALGNNSRFVLIGFSMGGIISRYYLQCLGGFNRVNDFFSISTPHHGSYLAYLYYGKGTKQLRPDSELLNSLESNQKLLKGINLYSYRTPFDLSIIPSKSSLWDIAENKKFYTLLHPLMLFNKKIIQAIIDNTV